ncbi:MAG TPA: NAD(P)-dependent oxidoreductase [Leptolyngbyaceae cyanobacterium M33_DOE_097]|uniref:NAD(P)-dependent oxidoreductase n=1 Tax=Oscillatoriales cyanobacterium SpSt-418 TaxID=2282169 RepID=A0A7C3PF94_9CYAN|nr:NAD(P)-dependent oxidoreductase [Leptolyngbyaceae cyanobacterium M33_DOE_097]
MTSKRIFLTGASGCIGHYVAEAFIQETDHELYLLVRDPAKLRFNYNARPGVHIVQGDLRKIEEFADLLQTIDCAILIATSWGGPEEVYEVNVKKTLSLIEHLNPDRCEQIIYFSTASILDRKNQPLPQAKEFGTDYIRSKYICYQELHKLAIAPKITTLFPTLLLGGDNNKPYSHVSSGIAQVARWIDVIRFLRIDGSFHFIHGKDVAQIVQYLADHPSQATEPRQFVLGNARTTVDQLIEESCAYLNKRMYFRIPLTFGLADLIIRLFHIKMAEWDRFSMEYRHFTHQDVTSPQRFHLPTYCATVADILRISGLRPHKRPFSFRKSVKV